MESETHDGPDTNRSVAAIKDQLLADEGREGDDGLLFQGLCLRGGCW